MQTISLFAFQSEGPSLIRSVHLVGRTIKRRLDMFSGGLVKGFSGCNDASRINDRTFSGYGLREEREVIGSTHYQVWRKFLQSRDQLSEIVLKIQICSKALYN